MFYEEVRSSKLKTSLFSSKDSGAFEVTSPSTLIKPGVYVVLLGRRPRTGLEIGSSSLLVQKLGSLMVTIRFITPTLTKCAFMRLTSSVDFVSLYIPSLESFSPSYNFLQPS